MACKHQFFEIDKISKSTGTAQPIANRYNDTKGVRAGCLFCGEIRAIWATGEIVVEVTGYVPKH